eukprot:s440_g11.t1
MTKWSSEHPGNGRGVGYNVMLRSEPSWFATSLTRASLWRVTCVAANANDLFRRPLKVREMPRGVFSTVAESQGVAEPRAPKAVKTTEEPVIASQASPLAFAARIGDLVEVRRLLDAKSDPNSADAVGETPVFEAAASGNVSVLATLLLAGADPEHQSLIGSVASDLCSSEACATLLRLCGGEEVTLEEREAVLRALTADLRPSIRSFMQSLSGEEDEEDKLNSLDIDFDKPPKLIRKSLDDEDGDDWTFAAAMVEQARKSRAKQRHKRPVKVEQVELTVSHALNDRQITLKLMSNSTFADAKRAILDRLREEGKLFKKFYFVKKERSTYQAYKALAHNWGVLLIPTPSVTSARSGSSVQICRWRPTQGPCSSATEVLGSPIC